jgi:flagellar biosynthesis chaperone FliJ
MTADDWWTAVRELIEEPMVLSADRNKEARGNLCAVSTSDDLAQEVSMQDLTDFLEDVIAARQQQLSKTMNAVDMTFYVWLDQQASGLAPVMHRSG